MSGPALPPESVDGLTPLTIEVVGDEATPIILCRGEIDAATAPFLRDALDGLRTTEMTLDLEAVTFIDSAGIQVIAAAMRRLRPTGGTVTVSAASRPVRRVFDIAGLGDVIAG